MSSSWWLRRTLKKWACCIVIQIRCLASATRLLTVQCHEIFIPASAITCVCPVGAKRLGFVCAFVFAANCKHKILGLRFDMIFSIEHLDLLYLPRYHRRCKHKKYKYLWKINNTLNIRSQILSLTSSESCFSDHFLIRMHTNSRKIAKTSFFRRFIRR